MVSLFPDFKYHIFISYRQKDNNGDRWISDFVEALDLLGKSWFMKPIYDHNLYLNLEEVKKAVASEI